jgi:nucleotide-binding universal stress UspA family protein
MIGKVLAAVDGSETARRALDFACDLAGKYEAELVLVSVAPTLEVPEELEHFAEVEHIEARPVEIYQTILENMLKSLRQKAQDAGVKEVRTRVEFGDPAKRILATAKDEQADVIVMGSRGLGELKGLLLGSVSHKVASQASCACVTVN